MLLTLGAWFHNIDPVIVQIQGNLAIRWYGLSYIAGFAIAWLLLRWMAGRKLVLIPRPVAFDFIVQVAIGVIVGGRLGYVLFYQPDLLMEFESAFPWWGVLNIPKGGMASHGGMIGMIIAAWLWARKWRAAAEKDPSITPPPLLHLLDVICLISPPGILMGRIANFINGELLGRIVAMPGEPGPWWSVRFPQELTEPNLWPELTAAQQSDLARMVLSVEPTGDVARGAAILIREAQLGNPVVVAELEALTSARHPSQLYQAFAEGVLTFLVMWWLWRRPRKPGMMLAVFLMVYGVGRVATEFIRLPDAHLQMQRIAGLSRGQWLSVAMVVIGAGLLWWVVRRSRAAPLGGWATAVRAQR